MWHCPWNDVELGRPYLSITDGFVHVECSYLQLSPIIQARPIS